MNSRQNSELLRHGIDFPGGLLDPPLPARCPSSLAGPQEARLLTRTPQQWIS